MNINDNMRKRTREAKGQIVATTSLNAEFYDNKCSYSLGSTLVKRLETFVLSVI